MQLVGMNKQTGQLGLVIPIAFIQDLVISKKFIFGVNVGTPDGYLVFTGGPDDDGPWVFVQKRVDQKFEILGEL